MQFKALLIGVIVFVAAVAIGVISSETSHLGEIPENNSVIVKDVRVRAGDDSGSGKEPAVVTGDGSGTGRGIGSGKSGPPDNVMPACAGTCKAQITSKPRASYTDAARQNNVQGNVTLRVILLESGEVGAITPINGLPDGLTEQAIAAARQIRFDPAAKDGTPVTSSVTIQYGFTIY